jgi:DNA replication and repair protein RecF
MTTAGPHRDDLQLNLGGTPATLGSEGQQRTLVLSLRLAAARLLEAHHGEPPLLLLDDIFGELDLSRRAALLEQLPKNAQQIITTTRREWLPSNLQANVLDLESR